MYSFGMKSKLRDAKFGVIVNETRRSIVYSAKHILMVLS